MISGKSWTPTQNKILGALKKKCLLCTYSLILIENKLIINFYVYNLKKIFSCPNNSSYYYNSNKIFSHLHKLLCYYSIIFMPFMNYEISISIISGAKKCSVQCTICTIGLFSTVNYVLYYIGDHFIMLILTE